MSFITICICDYMDITRPAEYFIWPATSCSRDSTRSKQLPTVAILGFQFGLYHVVAPLRFLRSISLASLLTFKNYNFLFHRRYAVPTLHIHFSETTEMFHLRLLPALTIEIYTSDLYFCTNGSPCSQDIPDFHSQEIPNIHS